jgi:hypothetical protein
MKTRITEQALDAMAIRCGRLTGKRHVIDSAYGGYKLAVIDEQGGQRDITGGYIPKRELAGRIQAYIEGIFSNN